MRSGVLNLGWSLLAVTACGKDPIMPAGGQMDAAPVADTAAVAPDIASAGDTPSDQTVDTSPSPDAVTAAWCDPAPSQNAANSCFVLPTARVIPCGEDTPTGEPSQTAYMEIQFPCGKPSRFVCATSWLPDTTAGYAFTSSETFVDDPRACCTTDSGITPITPDWPAAQNSLLGALHAPAWVKPQEFANHKYGYMRHNPFAIAITDKTSGDVFKSALPVWESWSGDGLAHQVPQDGQDYYFPFPLTINYIIVEDATGRPIIVAGPEVSVNPDLALMENLGHPTLSPCASQPGTPLSFIGGEIRGTTLNNRSGRFGSVPSVTSGVLYEAAKLFNSFGVLITDISYKPPRI